MKWNKKNECCFRSFVWDSLQENTEKMESKFRATWKRRLDSAVHVKDVFVRPGVTQAFRLDAHGRLVFRNKVDPVGKDQRACLQCYLECNNGQRVWAPHNVCIAHLGSGQ